ncbi:hypothetical protein GCM10011413_02170 [Pedobacter psychrotolerans]|uniref:Uncharacterized protein n=1 Tax=Pedobacter psychrotolerans TaxID=1843235 RepID=A0ABQ1SHA6_9SPHI|nr:hypothetical protein GCM10011413_02170 [Pedobacter psychrotolerans]
MASVGKWAEQVALIVATLKILRDYIYGDRLITFWKWQWERIHKDTDDMKSIDKYKKNEAKK